MAAKRRYKDISVSYYSDKQEPNFCIVFKEAKFSDGKWLIREEIEELKNKIEKILNESKR